MNPITPVDGAARYLAGGSVDGKFCVFMKDTEGCTFEVQSNIKTFDGAFKVAKKWQEKENKTVLKEAARVTKEASSALKRLVNK